MVAVAKKPGWIALGGALIFHLLLLSLQTNHQGSPGFLRQRLVAALVPAEKLVDLGVQGIWGVWDGYFALVGVRDQNHRIQAENDRLKMQIEQQDEAIREAARLRAFFSLTESGIGKLVAARVIGRDPSRSLQTVTIDKGQAAGVKPNASVINADGVVGRVISSGNGSAVVQLITDAQSEVAALFRGSRVQVLFKGTGGSDLELDYTDDDTAIAIGDEVITSGLDQIHPKGLPLAIVIAVGQKGELFKVVLARPHVNMLRIEEVLVVTEPAPASAEPAGGHNKTSAPLPGD